MLRIIFVILVLGSLLMAKPVVAQAPINTAVASASLVIESKEFDERVTRLYTFLKNQNSPLTPFAQEFIEAADEYNLDWRLVPAITGVESSFGKRIPSSSYNAYGWNNGVYKFNSWEQSIWHVAKTLRERYLNRGATTVSAIGKIYAPPSLTWANKVNYFMAKIESTPTYTLDF